MHNHYIALFLIFLFAASCTERIEIDTDDAPPQLTIYGHITTDTMRHTISITCSTGYFSTSRPKGVSHATVTISSDNHTFTLTESDTEAGVYQTEADVFGIEGETYILNVILDLDNNGETEQYTATSYLPHCVRMDSIALSPSADYKDDMEILAWSKLSSDKDCFYNFRAYRNDVSLNDSLSLFSLSDGEMVGVDEVTGMACYFLKQNRDKSKLAVGDKVTLSVDVLTRDYGIFLMNAQNEVFGTSPFSGPPANMETNIICTEAASPLPISGFFTAYSTQAMSTVWRGTEK